MTYADALELKIPFGKYKGQTLGALINSDDEDDVSYVDWLMGLEDLKSKRLIEALDAIREHRRSGGDREPIPENNDIGEW